jgi:uncharacterized membrane protein YdjX (TVP38/TMEM64 family)
MFILNIKVKKKWFVLTAFALAILGALMFLPIESYTKVTLDWVEGLGYWGYFVFFLIYVLFTVLFLPGFILTVGAGAIFNLWGGFITVSLASTMGASLAFLIGRFFARRAIEKKIADSRKFAAIDNAVGREGWKIVFLTRLSPVFPFNLLNYAYGLTRVKFSHYVLSSWVGMMPGTLLYVYIGAVAGDIARLALAEQPETDALQMAFRIIGLIATIIVTLYVTRIARNALREEMPKTDQ